MSTNLADLFIPEFDREMPRTRKVLSAITPESLTWQPESKLHNIGWNANHIVDIVSWTRTIIDEDEFDMAPVDAPTPEVLNLTDPDEIIRAFDSAIIDARSALVDTTDETMAEDWSLKAGGHAIFTLSKGDCLRTWVFNHIVHHRAILSIYVRMAGIELTPIFDE